MIDQILSSNKAPRRTFLSLTVMLLLVLIVWVISMVQVYFHSGATWETPADYGQNILLKTAPAVEWINYVPKMGMTPDPFLRQEIEKGYLKAWQALNVGLRTKNAELFQDHFAESLWAHLEGLIDEQEGYLVEQADLSHHLELHTFSLDKQVIAFTDRGVNIKKKLQTVNRETTIYKGLQKADFQVVMTLDDGEWRIRHFKRQESSSNLEAWPPPPDSGRVEMVGHQFLVDGVVFQPAGINYYPMDTPWFDFWLHFDTVEIKKDLALIHGLGLNTIRIFVFYELFGGNEIKEEMMIKLDQMLRWAHEFDLKVVVTLFDFLPTYAIQSYPSAEKHLKQILSRFRRHPAVLAWDLKNEPNLDFSVHGEQVVLEWLEYMLPRARRYDPYHPLTIGWSAAGPAVHLSDEVDFLSFHFYLPVDSLSTQLDTLHRLARGKHIMISEFGLSTHKHFLLPNGPTEAEQATYYESVLDTLAAYPATSFVSWTLFDFPDLPESVFSGPFWKKIPQKNYGIIRSDGNAKPAAVILSRWLAE